MLTREDLYGLEKYAEIRQAFRAKVIEHKKNRRVALGEHAALYFEDALTMQYQVQEMLRIERIFEAKGIQEELDVYNPLVPDGSNWKATFMVEYPEETERRQALARLVGIEEAVWVRVGRYQSPLSWRSQCVTLPPFCCAFGARTPSLIPRPRFGETVTDWATSSLTSTKTPRRGRKFRANCLPIPRWRA